MKDSIIKRIESANTADELAVLLFNLPHGITSRNIADKLMQLMSDGNVLIRFASARAISREFMEASPPQVLDIMMEVINNPAPIKSEFNRLYSTLKLPGSSVVHLACIGACLVAKNCSRNILPELIKLIDKHSASDATTISHALLYLAFHDNSNRPLRLSELSEIQRQVIQTIASSKYAWRLNGNMEISLKQFGLPPTKNELLQFLNSPV